MNATATAAWQQHPPQVQTTNPIPATHRDEVIVVGGGMAGLTAAYRLMQTGVRVRLLEAEASHLGGVIRSARTEAGYQLDLGPNTLRGAGEAALLLADELGLGEQRLLSANVARRRYLMRVDKPRLVGVTPFTLLGSPLLSLRGRGRMLLEAFAEREGERWQDPAYDESVASFVTRRLGREVAERLVDPVLGGIYAGDIHRMSARATMARLVELAAAHGRLTTGALARLRKRKDKRSRNQQQSEPTASPYAALKRHVYSYQGGLSRLPAALATALGERVACGRRVVGLSPAPAGGYFVFVTRAGEASRPVERLHAQRVILATPGHQTARLLAPLDVQVAALLERIEYQPMLTVALGYRISDLGISPQGFGFLIPRAAKRRTLGAIFTSSVFPGRAPAGHLLLNAFLGGANDPHVLEELDDNDAVIRTVHDELREPLRVRAKQPAFAWVRRWVHALPLFAVGHRERLAELHSRLTTRLPGVELAGAYLDGIGVNDAVLSGEQAATTVAAQLRT